MGLGIVSASHQGSLEEGYTDLPVNDAPIAPPPALYETGVIYGTLEQIVEVKSLV